MTVTHNRWAVLGALSIFEIFLFGPSVATLGVFFTPLIQEFHWSHAEVSQLASSVDVSLGLCSLLAGWLLDRFDVRWVMSAGAAVAGVGFLAASQSHSLPVMVACYAVIGLGVSMGFMVAIAMIAGNWFPDRTGLAIGIGSFGMAIGLSFSPRIIAAVVVHAGWRVGMIAAGLPMLLVAVPIALLFLRTRPPAVAVARASVRSSIKSADCDDIPGLKVRAALGTLPMWLLILINFFSQYGLGAVYFHTIPYLLSVGFPIGIATLIFGVKGFFFGPGSILWGAAADRFGPRLVIFCGFMLFATSVLLLLVAGTHRYGLAPLLVYVVLWGMDTGATVAVPALLAQAMGKRSYGSLNGILTFAASAGQGVGPLVSGLLIDRTKGYTLAFEFAVIAILISAVLGPMVRRPKEIAHDNTVSTIVD
ncbi:MAG: MFS transporter [Gammaproteobacteria bacterium]|nr:MFS transporter [Gammaproteobacteria bacterium]